MIFPNRIENVHTMSVINTGLTKNEKLIIFFQSLETRKNRAVLKAVRKNPAMIVNQLKS
jgi:hypothetical protein